MSYFELHMIMCIGWPTGYSFIFNGDSLEFDKRTSIPSGNTFPLLELSFRDHAQRNDGNLFAAVIWGQGSNVSTYR